MRRLDLLDFLLTRAVLGAQQQVERLDHRRLPDLIGAADHHHAAVGKLDLAVGDAAVVGQHEAMQLHATPLSTSRSSSASAARASSASSPSARAVLTSSSTAAAANPPMPRSSNSPSAGITAMSVCLFHGSRAANSRAYLSRQPSSAALSVTVSDPLSPSRTTVRSLFGIRSRLMSRSATSRLLSTARHSVTKRQLPTR